MVANGSRSVTRSGPSLTAESSVACLASQGRGSTTPESTSEYRWSSVFLVGSDRMFSIETYGIAVWPVSVTQQVL